MCSFSQVMLQKNVLTGFIFFLAVGFSSLIMLVGSTLATISALVVAKLCKYQLTSVQSGLYGFNAVLVGIAVFHFLPFSTVSLLFVVSGGVISSLLMHLMLMRLKSIPALTTPFILTTWLILIIAEHLGVTSALQNNVQPSNIQTTNLPNVVEFFFAALRGIAQVMLQDNWLCGALFLCALALHSIRVAACAIAGVSISTLIAVNFNCSPAMTLSGEYGFNSVLVAIAIATRYPKKYGYIMLSILVSVLLTSIFEQLSFPALTAPFVLSTWFMICLNNVIKQCH